jgi:hypothetical protein
MFLHNLLNVLVQIAKKMGLQKKCKGHCGLRKRTVATQEVRMNNKFQDLPYRVEMSSDACRQQKQVGPEEGNSPSETRKSLLQSDSSRTQLRYLELIDIII